MMLSPRAGEDTDAVAPLKVKVGAEYSLGVPQAPAVGGERMYMESA